MKTIWLVLAVAPYLVLAAIDAWLHERSRQVPLVEKWLHAALGISLVVFLVAAFRSEAAAALVALGVLVPLAAVDEFGYHAHLQVRERRIHYASYAALGLFVATWWLWQPALA